MFGSRGEPMLGWFKSYATGIGVPFRSRPPSLFCSAPSSQLQPQFHPGAGPVGRGVRFDGEGGHRDRASFPGVLQLPVIDLSRLNGWVDVYHFHMETAQSVLQSLRPGDWMVSLDLQDAYLQVPVHPSSCHYLRFCVGGCGLPVSLPVLRSLDGSPGIHPRHGSCIFDHASSRFPHSPVPR